MRYRYAAAGNYEDYAGGRVFYSAPGQSAFPVRLVSEVFQRAYAHWQAVGNNGRCALYDPCCGGAYHLAVLGYLHGDKIKRFVGSDVDADALELAQRNLSLLTPVGLAHRLAEINSLYAQYQKPSHLAAKQAAHTFQQHLQAKWPDSVPVTQLFQANALQTGSMQKGLGGLSCDLVLTDIPYGQTAHWQLGGIATGNSDQPISLFLNALAGVLREGIIVAIAGNKQTKVIHEQFKRIEKFQVGKRRITILQRR